MGSKTTKYSKEVFTNKGKIQGTKDMLNRN